MGYVNEFWWKSSSVLTPSPCGTENNPHVMHPARYPDGPCINCGWMKPKEG